VLHGNDHTGSCSYTPSVVVRKKRFRRKFVFPKEWIAPLIATWGVALVGDFFVRLETIGGHYDARSEEFTHPDYHWSSPPLAVRSASDDVSLKRIYVQGSIPDERRYHDASKPAIILPHLRLVGDKAILRRIKAKARHPAVRLAASSVLRE